MLARELPRFTVTILRLLSQTRAREAAFDCSEWSKLAPNATRDDISVGGFRHDIYEASFDGDFERAVDWLLAYRVFAPHRMVARVCTADRRVALEATIIQRVLLGPVAIETAVRVIEVERTADCASYAYATLQGHPERGIASFAVIRTEQSITFQAQAWSRAGNWLTIAGRPVSRVLQRAITREAVSTFCGAPWSN